jgi:hypothetical protein
MLNLSEDTINFIKSAPYKEIEAELILNADKLFTLTDKDEALPFTERLMKQYSIEKAKAYYLAALRNNRGEAFKKEFEKISWK